MDFVCNFPLFTVVPCLLSAVICSMVNGKAARRLTTCVLAAISALSAVVMVWSLKNGTAFIYKLGFEGAPWGNELRAGALEGLLGLAAGLVLCMSVLGGVRFIERDITEKKENLYYLLINLVGAAVMALIYTNDIFSGFVYLEILTLSSCGILMIRDIGKTTLAATRYLILNLMGSGLYLLGIILAYDITGHLLMEPMAEKFALLAAGDGHIVAASVSVGLICVGLAIKSGLFPFHFWMQDTYGSATPASASVLSGVVSKGYIFLMAKIIIRVVGVDSPLFAPVKTIFLFFGILGIVFGSVGAMHQSSLNRMIALSSAAQIGYIYVGAAMGTETATCAAFLHMITHMLTKPLLFLASARLTEVSSGSPKFRDLLGSGRRDPFAGAMFTLGAFSMMGIPAFAGFSSKLYFCVAAVELLSPAVKWSVLLALAVSTVLNTYYFMRTCIRIWAPGGESVPAPKHEGAFVVASLVLAGLNVAIGIFSEPIANAIIAGIGMLA